MGESARDMLEEADEFADMRMVEGLKLMFSVLLILGRLAW